MTKTTVEITDITDSAEAGTALGNQILKALDGTSPDVIVIFASSRYSYEDVLKAIKKVSNPTYLIGCSSAGEFTSKKQAEGSISALAISSTDMEFSIGIGHQLKNDVKKAAEELYSSFKGSSTLYPYKNALILADALAGYTDDLIDSLNQLTAGMYQFFGGGAGDDANFSKTHVFFDTKAYTDAVVSLEILSKKPIGVGVRHGWQTASKPFRVTESDGMKVVSLNGVKAIDIFKEHAIATKQKLDLKDPVPFFLHNALGIKTVGGYQLRVPLQIGEDGSVYCASDVPTGVTISIMQTTSESAEEAAKDATEDAMLQIKGEKAAVALFFDCVATRLRTGTKFINELESLQKGLGTTKYVGCNTYGQIARVDGQFNGFHNCTAVVCVIPE